MPAPQSAQHQQFQQRSGANPTLSTSGALFQKAKVTLSRLKVGLFGEQGSGKTTTATLIAIGLSKLYHNGAPIFMHDTEAGSDFLVELCEIEGIDLLVRKSRSFQDMCAGLAQAQREGACAYIEDSITSDWAALTEKFRKDRNINRIEIYHWSEIKPKWNDEWVVPMLNANVHVLTCGRQGDKWENVTQQDGTTKAETVGVKMKAEGEFGYEPFLLLNMAANQALVGAKGGKGGKRSGTFVHHCTVLKDKTRAIQGLEFDWPDINNYKKGDWKKVFDKIAPHAKFFQIDPQRPHEALADEDAQRIFDMNANSDYYKRKQDRAVLIEEIEGVLVALWPGTDAKSKKFKADTLERLFQTRSWTKISEVLQWGELEIGLVRLRNMRIRTANTPLDNEDTVKAVLEEAMKYTTPEEKAEGDAAKSAAIEAQFGDAERAVYAVLKEGEDTTLDDVIESANVGASAAMGALSDLELKGFVGQLPGKRYVRVPLNRVPEQQPVAAA